MQIHSSPDAYEGELPVHMNPGGAIGHFGILCLGADVHVNVETDEDADRIVRAAMRIKAMRAALGKPHAHERGAGPHGSHCTVCGLLKDATEHAAPEPGPPAAAGDFHPSRRTGPAASAVAAPAWCPAVTEVSDATVYCDRENGHDGSHHAPGPDEGSEVAWSDEPEAEQQWQCPDGRLLDNDGTIRHCRKREGHDGPHRDAGLNEWDASDPAHVPNVHPRVWPPDEAGIARAAAPAATPVIIEDDEDIQPPGGAGLCADWPGTAPDDGQTYSGDPDPFGPEAYKTHRPGCACPDCQADDDEPPVLCDSTLPLPRAGHLRCTLDDGHFGAHSALAGERRWLGTGDNARWESGIRVVPESSRS